MDEMARGAGEPSAKRVKAGEADKEEEEDPLVRRKEEVVRLLEEASAKGKDNAHAKEELSTLCARLEAKNEKLLGRMLPDLWSKILDENLDQNDLVALAMTCRFFREKQKGLGWKMATELTDDRLLELQKSGKVTSYSMGWFRWVCDTFKILPGCEWLAWGGDVYEGNLVNYAAFQGSVEIMRWLVEVKGGELNEETGFWAGRGGSVEVLEYVRGRGYEFDEGACQGAARGGHLEALKFLRGQDPPCPWNVATCYEAAKGGHLEVLKWARDQDPPCRWDEWTCEEAAGGGHLEVLKWARDQDPPCPWNERTCQSAVRGGHLEVLKWARSQDPPCPWNESTCSGAAEEGHLEVLKWARSQDPPCPWGEATCHEAVGRGHLDVLKWARSQDPPCPWSRSECRERARRYGHQHVVDWIDQQEDESDVEFSDSD